MSNLAKSLLDMEKEAANLVVKSEKFQGASSAVTASISKADSDAATANGDLSDAKEKTDKKVSEVEGSFQKSEDIKASEVAEGASKTKEGKEEDCKKSEDLKDQDSLEKSVQASEVGAKAFEISPFLAEMTNQLSKSLGDIRSTLNISNKDTEDTMGAFAKSFGAMAKSQQLVMEQNVQLTELVKSMSNKFEDMSARMEEIEGQPTMRKSVRNIAVHEKDFVKSISGSPAEISKSEKISIMNDLFAKGDTVQPMDILNIESGSILRPEVEARIAQIAAERR